MAKLDLDWLGVFVEVYKTQNVSRAALALGIEQASASIALNKLRRHFGDPLFCRTSRGMEPTPRAKAAQTELLVVVPRRFGDALALQERVQLLEPPVELPSYKVKQHWHERFNLDPGSQWLRQTLMTLFAEKSLRT